MISEKIEEVCNFLNKHQNDVDVRVEFAKAKEIIAQDMFQSKKKEAFLNLSINEMCEEWAVARYIAHFCCVEEAETEKNYYERTLSLAYNNVIDNMLRESASEVA